MVQISVWVVPFKPIMGKGVEKRGGGGRGDYQNKQISVWGVPLKPIRGRKKRRGKVEGKRAKD